MSHTVKEHISLKFDISKARIIPSYKYKIKMRLEGRHVFQTFNESNQHWNCIKDLKKHNIKTLRGNITFQDHFELIINNKSHLIQNFVVHKIKDGFEIMTVLKNKATAILNLKIMYTKLDKITNDDKYYCDILLTPAGNEYFNTQLKVIGEACIVFCHSPQQALLNHTINPTKYRNLGEVTHPLNYYDIDAFYLKFYLNKTKNTYFLDYNSRENIRNYNKPTTDVITCKSHTHNIVIESVNTKYDILYDSSVKKDANLLDFNQGFKIQHNKEVLDFSKFSIKYSKNQIIRTRLQAVFDMYDANDRKICSFQPNQMNNIAYDANNNPIAINVIAADLNFYLDSKISGTIEFDIILKPRTNRSSLHKYKSIWKEHVKIVNLRDNPTGFEEGQDVEDCTANATADFSSPPPQENGNASTWADPSLSAIPYKWSPQFVTITSEGTSNTSPSTSIHLNITSIGSNADVMGPSSEWGHFASVGSVSCNNQNYYMKNKYSRAVIWSRSEAAANYFDPTADGGDGGTRTYRHMPCIFSTSYGKIYNSTASEFEGFFMCQLGKGGGKSGFVTINSGGSCVESELCYTNKNQDNNFEIHQQSARALCEDGCACEGCACRDTDNNTLTGAAGCAYNQISDSYGGSYGGNWLALARVDPYTAGLNDTGDSYREFVRAAKGLYADDVPGSYSSNPYNNCFHTDGRNFDDANFTHTKFQNDWYDSENVSDFTKFVYWERRYTLSNSPTYLPKVFMQNSRIEEGLHLNGNYPQNLKFQNCNVFSKTNSFSTSAADLAYYKGSICVLDLLWEKTEKAEGVQTLNDFENMPKLNQDSKVFNLPIPNSTTTMEVHSFYSEQNIYYKDRMDYSLSSNNAEYNVVDAVANTDYGISTDTPYQEQLILYSKTVVGCMRIASQAYKVSNNKWRYYYNILNWDFDPRISKLRIPIGSGNNLEGLKTRVMHNNYISPNMQIYVGNNNGNWVADIDVDPAVDELVFVARNNNTDITWTPNAGNSSANVSKVPLGWGEVACFSFESEREPDLGVVTLEHYEPIEMDWDMHNNYSIPKIHTYAHDNHTLIQKDATIPDNSRRQWFNIPMGAIVPKPYNCPEGQIFNCLSAAVPDSACVDSAVFGNNGELEFDCFGLCGGIGITNDDDECTCPQVANTELPYCNCPDTSDLSGCACVKDSCGICDGSDERFCVNDTNSEYYNTCANSESPCFGKDPSNSGKLFTFTFNNLIPNSISNLPKSTSVTQGSTTGKFISVLDNSVSVEIQTGSNFTSDINVNFGPILVNSSFIQKVTETILSCNETSYPVLNRYIIPGVFDSWPDYDCEGLCISKLSNDFKSDDCKGTCLTLDDSNRFFRDCRDMCVNSSNYYDYDSCGLCTPATSEITFNLQLDNWGSDISWFILDPNTIQNTNVCLNNDTVVDSYGDTCSEWYDNYPNTCGEYDTVDFVSANLCCACGGGIECSSGDILDDDLQCDECENDDTVVDSYGDTCSEWYDKNPSGCGLFDTDTFIAAERCCACQCPSGQFLLQGVCLNILERSPTYLNAWEIDNNGLVIVNNSLVVDPNIEKNYDYTFQLPFGNYTLVVNDSIGDGMVTSSGTLGGYTYDNDVAGNYTLLNSEGDSLATITDDSDFGFQAIHEFSLERNISTNIWGCEYPIDSLSYPYSVDNDVGFREFTWSEMKLDQEKEKRQFGILAVDPNMPGKLPNIDEEDVMYQVWGYSERFRSYGNNSLERHTGGVLVGNHEVINTTLKILNNDTLNEYHSPEEGVSYGYPSFNADSTVNERGYAFCSNCDFVPGGERLGLCDFNRESFKNECPNGLDTVQPTDSRIDNILKSSPLNDCNKDGETCVEYIHQYVKTYLDDPNTIRVPWHFCHMIDVGYGSVYDDQGGDCCYGNLREPMRYLGTINFEAGKARQVIKISEGWSLFSTYISKNKGSLISFNVTDLNNKFNKYQVVIKDNNGNTYTSTNYNTSRGLENTTSNFIVEAGKGYWMYSNKSFNLTVDGYYNKSLIQNIILNDTWNIVGTYNLESKKIETIIDYNNNVVINNNDLELIEDSEGNRIYSNNSVNTIGYLIPGKAYLTKK